MSEGKSIGAKKAKLAVEASKNPETRIMKQTGFKLLQTAIWKLLHSRKRAMAHIEIIQHIQKHGPFLHKLLPAKQKASGKKGKTKNKQKTIVIPFVDATIRGACNMLHQSGRIICLDKKVILHNGIKRKFSAWAAVPIGHWDAAQLSWLMKNGPRVHSKYNGLRRQVHGINKRIAKFSAEGVKPLRLGEYADKTAKVETAQAVPVAS